MHPTTKQILTISLSILFLILLFASSTNASELDLPVDTSWTHTQIQEGTSTATTCFFGLPALDSSGNGEIFVIHERRCWETEDAGVETFRTTDLLNFTSITHEPNTEVFQTTQIRYNQHHDEFYACSYTADNTERYFYFWHANGTAIHTNNSNQLTIGSSTHAGFTCGMGHVPNQQGAYNIVTCRSSINSLNITHTLKHTDDYAQSILAPSSDTSDEFGAGTTPSDRCDVNGQLIVKQESTTGATETTTWLYAPRPAGIQFITERSCLWNTGSDQCTSSNTLLHQTYTGGHFRGFAGYEDGTNVVTALAYATTHFNQETRQHENYRELLIRKLEWGTGHAGTTFLANLEDIVPPYGENFGQQFGFDHQVRNPCVWQRENIGLISYFARHEDTDESFINVHVSKDGGTSWSAPSKVISTESISTGTPVPNSKGNCITYDASMHKVGLGYVVNGATDPSVGGAWVASVDFDAIDLTLNETGPVFQLPTGTTQSGTTFFGAPLAPISEAWNLPLPTIQWLVGFIIVLIVVATVAWLGLFAIIIAVVVGIGWAFVSGMFPVWFLALVALLISLGVGMSIFGGKE